VEADRRPGRSEELRGGRFELAEEALLALPDLQAVAGECDADLAHHLLEFLGQQRLVRVGGLLVRGQVLPERGDEAAQQHVLARGLLLVVAGAQADADVRLLQALLRHRGGSPVALAGERGERREVLGQGIDDLIRRESPGGLQPAGLFQVTLDDEAAVVLDEVCHQGHGNPVSGIQAGCRAAAY
jgi:hypothetical protein